MNFARNNSALTEHVQQVHDIVALRNGSVAKCSFVLNNPSKKFQETAITAHHGRIGKQCDLWEIGTREQMSTSYRNDGLWVSFLFLGIAFRAFLWYFVLLQKVKYVNELLKELHDNFFEKLPAMQLKAEIERCHQELIEKLDKPERKLVL